jgi:hypothetical protein
MKELLAAILTTWNANAAAAVVSPPSAAGPLNGINGPFWDAAPEKTAFPYCILRQNTAPRNIWGFGGGVYAEFVGVQFVVFASDATNGGLLKAAGYADAISGVYDNSRMTLGNGELVKMARRVYPAMMKKEQNYAMDGVAVYSGTLSYEYATQRTR